MLAHRSTPRSGATASRRQRPRRNTLTGSPTPRRRRGVDERPLHARLYSPDLVGVFRDSPVGREAAHACDREQRLARPRAGLGPELGGPLVGAGVRDEVREMEVALVV